MATPPIEVLSETDWRVKRSADGKISQLIDGHGSVLLTRGVDKLASAAPALSVVAAAATFTTLTAADSLATPGKVKLTSAGLHGLTTSPAVGAYVYVAWTGAGHTGVDGLYAVLSVDSTLIITIDMSSVGVASFGTPAVTVAGAAITLATVPIPAGTLGDTGALRVTPVFGCTTSGNNKTLSTALGTSAVTAVVTTVTSYSEPVTWQNNTSAAQIVSISGSGTAIADGAQDTATDLNLVFSGTPAVANELIKLRAYTVELLA